MHATCTAHHTLLDLITLIILAAKYKLKVLILKLSPSCSHFLIFSALFSVYYRC